MTLSIPIGSECPQTNDSRAEQSEYLPVVPAPGIQRGQTAVETLFGVTEALLTIVNPVLGLSLAALHAVGATSPLNETTGELSAEALPWADKAADFLIEMAVSTGLGELVRPAVSLLPSAVQPLAEPGIAILGDRIAASLVEDPGTGILLDPFETDRGTGILGDRFAGSRGDDPKANIPRDPYEEAPGIRR